MINRYFNVRLFKEGVRQSRLIGFISLTVILSFTSLIWFGNFAEQWEYPTQTLFNFFTIGGLLAAQYCITTPLMVLHLFRFLNRRDSSDFYHAIPHTRESLSVSYFAAIMCWNVITSLAMTALIFLLYGLAPYMTINLPTVFPYLFNMFSAQLLVAAAVLFAMSITGTVFSNIAVSLMVIFVPRLLLMVMSNMIEHHCVVVDIAQQVPFLSPCLNVAAGLPLSLLLSFGSRSDLYFKDCILNPTNGVYTLIVALLIFLAAIVLLKKRQSETAGKSSPTRLLQAIYRITFGVVIGMLPMYMAFDSMNNDILDRVGSWMGLLACTMIAVFCYFLFELVTTKKVKNLLRAVPGLFIFLLIDGVILAASFGIGNAILNFEPTVDTIQAVTVSQDEENYFVSKSGKVQLKDTASKAILARALSETVEMVESKNIHRTGFQIYGNYGSYMQTAIKVDFQTKFGHHYRYVLMQQADYDTLLNTVEQQEAYRQCFYDLPQPNKGNVVIEIADHELQNDSFFLSQAQKEQLYRVFQEEVKRMPFDQWYPMATEAHKGTAYTYANLELTISESGQNYWLTFPLQETFFPKTTQQYLDYYKPYADQALTDTKARLQKITDDDLALHEDYSIHIINYLPASKHLEIPENHLPDFTKQLLANAKPYTTVGTDQVVCMVTIVPYKQPRHVPQSTLIAIDPAYLDGYLFDIEE